MRRRPVRSHVLAVCGGAKKAIDDLFVRVWTGVLQERIDLGQRRRQPGQHERDAIDEVSLSASGESVIASRCSRRTIKRSISVNLPARERDLGTAGFCGEMNDQCGLCGAPATIQRRSTSIFSAVSVLLVMDGGMRAATFRCVTRLISSLLSRSPGIIARRPVSAFRTRGTFALIEPQTRASALLVRPVTLEAVLGKDWSDIPVVIDGVHPRLAREDGC